MDGLISNYSGASSIVDLLSRIVLLLTDNSVSVSKITSLCRSQLSSFYYVLVYNLLISALYFGLPNAFDIPWSYSSKARCLHDPLWKIPSGTPLLFITLSFDDIP